MSENRSYTIDVKLHVVAESQAQAGEIFRKLLAKEHLIYAAELLTIRPSDNLTPRSLKE